MSSRFLSRRFVLATVATIALVLAVAASVRAEAPSNGLGSAGFFHPAGNSGR